MADSDPISDSTPNKRRKLNHGNATAWDSQDEFGEDFTVDDFQTAATLPLSHPPPPKLEYTSRQLHADLGTSAVTGRAYSPTQTYITQPTQPLQQATQPLLPWQKDTQQTQTLHDSEVLVDRSSPPLASSPPPQKAPPQPVKRAFSRPGGLLASAMAPPGTAFRRPAGTQAKPSTINLDSDEDDPPMVHSSDDEATLDLKSKIKPTNFVRNGRGLDSTPNRIDKVVKESPKPASSSAFSGLMQEFGFSSSANQKPADDMISAYGNTSRWRKPQVQARQLGRKTFVNYRTVDEVDDYVLRRKVIAILETLGYESVQRCVNALLKFKGNVNDAQAWLVEDQEKDAPGEDEADELSSTSPPPPRGVAVSNASSQPIRPAAKQEIRAPTKTIAEKYGGSTQARKVSQTEDPQPQRRRLQQGRRPRSPTPPQQQDSSPAQKRPQPLQRLHRKAAIVISDDEDEPEAEASDSEIDEELPQESSHDQRLLKFFNECSVEDLADLSAQPQATVKVLIDQRPFTSLDQIREVSDAPSHTKAGKKSRAAPVGDKIVDACSKAWISYDAIDELVQECEVIAKPLQEALKSWGAGNADGGELQLMNLDEAHDSGIGTPASSCPSDDVAPRSTKKDAFLRQPPSMNPAMTLKDYQLVGLNWLNLMWSQKTSCILADDMGLGKTCQVISFLAHLQDTNVPGCALVVVPGSTLENWLREFQTFAPALSVRPYYGKQDERGELQYQLLNEIESVDVVVTTYEMATNTKGLVKDNSFLRRKLQPHICIFDEAHQLRNPGTDRYEALSRFPADFRVLLTGTPLQNNLKELVAILGFIMPDMFHEKAEALDYIFKHKATTKEPSENAALLSAQRILRARSMVTPFILRRKKHQVLELPTKHSRVEYCEMTESQADYYADMLQDAQQVYAAGTAGKAAAKQRSNILMNLRKAALHPLLGRRIFNDAKVEKLTELCLKHAVFGEARRDQVQAHLSGDKHDAVKGGDFGMHRFCETSGVKAIEKLALKKQPWMDSGKVIVLRRLLQGFVKNGDRVLCFSQFKIMMDILEAVLNDLGIKFMRLDGSTSVDSRQDMIDRFTTDESITVFMLSTRAGGAGINLAAANKVVIFDSGFNPQDDIQAENRAHRVGQTRDVEVIRLVTKGTIEEQIHALGESKLALDARVAGEENAKAADAAGERMLEQMFVESLSKDKDEGTKHSADADNLKDAFKNGLESAGLKVASKQAQF